MLSNKKSIFKNYLNCPDVVFWFVLYCFHRKGTSQNPFPESLTIFITDTVFRKQYFMLSV